MSQTSTVKIPELVPIRDQLPDAIYDIRYATRNNIAGKVLYPDRYELMLRETTLRKLQVASDLFKTMGLAVVIFDVLRTKEAHEALMQACTDPRYVNPNSGHLLGVSIDMGLADLKTGQQLDFGTGFDDMIDESNHGNTGISVDAQMLRLKLKEGNAQAGLVYYEGEWWHYDDLETRQILEAQQM